MRIKVKQLAFIVLLAVLSMPILAQERADTSFMFRFVPQKDVFFVPFRGNEVELNRLCTALQSNINMLRAGRMYICVSSYAATGNAKTSAQRMGYLRNSRVKSELIQRVGISEKMFVTDKLITTPYDDSLRNVVIVAFPASVEKIEQIAGAEAAEVVRTYYREIEEQKQSASEIKPDPEQQREQELAAREADAQREAEAERQSAAQAERQRIATLEHQRLKSEEQARLQTEANAKPYTFALRANLLRWATLTPDVGVQWRINRDWAVSVGGTWTSWSWDDSNRRYAMWEVSPEAHYYIGKAKQWYVGAMLHFGQFNYKLSDTGKQGDLQGGGIVGGYQLPIGKRLMLDFNLGIGCTHTDYDTYTVTDGVKVRTGNHSKNYWGVNKAGVTLVWKLF